MATGTAVPTDLTDDLVDWETPFQAFELSKLSGYSSPQYQINRRDAELWTVRDCKFLVFDDAPGEVQLEGKDYDSDDSNDALDWAFGLSLEENEAPETRTTSPKGNSNSTKPQTGESNTSDESVNDQGSSGGSSVKRELSQVDNTDEDKQPSSKKHKGKKVEGSGWSRAKSKYDASVVFYGNLGPNYVPPAARPDTESGPSTDSRHQEPPCRVCSKWPEFPHNRKSRKFRLIRPRDEFPDLFKGAGGLPSAPDVCTHYVAVSYCWPPRVEVQGKPVDTPRHYKVKDLNGTWRRNRALDDVLDRAVDVANTFGLRMIWIDQECLPQPPDDQNPPHKEDKQLGIQAMDIIYNRAFVTSGLQDVRISSQEELDLILELVAGSNSDGPSRAVANRRELNTVMHFVYRVSRDRWYTRAWVVQEAISAGDNLSLVFRRDPNVSCPSSVRLPTHRRRMPTHSLETEARQVPSKVVCLMVHEIRNLIHAVNLFVRGTSSKRDGQISTHTGPFRTHEEEAFEEFETLHPTFWQPRDSQFQFGGVGLTNFGIRPTTNAAGALSLLKSRGCQFHRDRLAIMANMCGYEFRINGDAIPAHCSSLRAALLALSLLNGDFSLLVPEAYTDSTIAGWRDHPHVRLLQGFRPGWVHPFDIDCKYLHHIQIRGFNLPRTHSRDFSPGVVRIPAFLWKVEDKPIDMTPVKLQWEMEWHRIKCVEPARLPVNGEDDETAHLHMMAITHHIEQPEVDEMIREELRTTGTISDASPIWNGINQYIGTVSFRLVLLADRVERLPRVQEVFTRIFFGLLRYLFDHADEDPRAQGAADSIWQSMRVDLVEEGQPALPDAVCEELFDHVAVRETPFKTIQLDRNHHEYYQVWLIDQIMSYGNLWVGRYMRDREPKREPYRLWPPDFFEIGPDGTIHRDPKVSDQEYWQSLADIHNMESWKKKQSLLGCQFRRTLFSIIQASKDVGWYSQMERGSDEWATDTEVTSHVTPGGMVGMLSRIGKEILGESEDYRVRQLVSVFNVRGPGTVAIPFDPAWEMIPHPSMRSMSVCWVVDHYRLPDLVESSTTCTILSEAGRSTETAVLAHSGPNTRPFIRVKEKVKGFWPIMGVPPWENYTLV